MITRTGLTGVTIKIFDSIVTRMMKNGVSRALQEFLNFDVARCNERIFDVFEIDGSFNIFTFLVRMTNE